MKEIDLRSLLAPRFEVNMDLKLTETVEISRIYDLLQAPMRFRCARKQVKTSRK
jgi:hypothetical protein